MPRKKAEEAQPIKKNKAERKISSKTNVFRGTGRRKKAIARVWLKLEKGNLIINDEQIQEYFKGEVLQKKYEEPFRVVNRIGQFSGTVKIFGGGASSQVDAFVHGTARALASYDPSFRQILSNKKLLTRDSRMKERRKYGHAGKARKMKQSPKR